MKKILLAGLLGGVVLFIWGAISWMALPWHNTTMHELPNGATVAKALGGESMTSGIYMYPGHEADDAMAETEQAMQESEGMVASKDPGMLDTDTESQAGTMGNPYIFMLYVAEGFDPANPAPFIGGFILNLITATLVAYLLSMVVSRFAQFSKRVMFVGLMGVFAALVSHISLWNWMLFPTDYSLVMAADLIIAWALAGLVIAWQIKPEKAATA